MRAWGLGLAVWLCAGCLLPQNESYLSELPVLRNRPPRIVENQVQPSDRIIRGYGTDLCELDFSVIVEDPDLSNVLTASWFVDYDPTHPRGADSVVRIEPKGGGTAVRDERATFHPTFDSADFNRLNTPGDHVIEVVVADSPTVIKLPDGTDFNDPAYSTSYAWFVRTEAGGNCP